MNTIEIGPDGPCLLAQRLVRRLLRDRLIQPACEHAMPRGREDAITEALADEIHQDAIDATPRRGK